MPYRRRRRVAGTVKRRAPVRRTTVRKIVRKEIRKNIEVKEKNYPHTAIGLVPGGASTSFSAASYGSGTAIAFLCNGIAQGTQQDQRVGNRIRVIGCKVFLAHQAGDTYNNYRLCLVRAKRSMFDQNAFTVANMAQSIFQTASSATQWSMPIDTDRWHVYFDKIYTNRFVPVDGSTATVSPVTKFTRLFKKMSFICEWDEVNTITSDLILVMISDSVAAAHPGCIAGHVKLFYTNA